MIWEWYWEWFFVWFGCDFDLILGLFGDDSVMILGMIVGWFLELFCENVGMMLGRSFWNNFKIMLESFPFLTHSQCINLHQILHEDIKKYEDFESGIKSGGSWAGWWVFDYFQKCFFAFRQNRFFCFLNENGTLSGSKKTLSAGPGRFGHVGVAIK